MKTIILDLPGGKRVEIDVSDDGRREWRIPLMSPPTLTFVGNLVRLEPAPLEFAVAEPSGEHEFRLSETGVSMLEIWRIKT